MPDRLALWGFNAYIYIYIHTPHTHFASWSHSNTLECPTRAYPCRASPCPTDRSPSGSEQGFHSYLPTFKWL